MTDECLKISGNFSLFFENTMKANLPDLLYVLDDRRPSIFPLYLGVDIFHYTSQIWWQDQFQHSTYLENILLPLPDIYVLLYPIYFEL